VNELVVVAFCMDEVGHLQRLRPLASGLARRGAKVFVFTDERFRKLVEGDGCRFVDLIRGRRPEIVDPETTRSGCRFVTFAGLFADEFLRDARSLRPSLILYDTFAVIGRAVALNLGIPYINVCAGHNVDPAKLTDELLRDPATRISHRCYSAVRALRERFNMADATPVSFISGSSPFLNVVCEPPEFLDEPDRRRFEPVAFFGSLLDALPPREELRTRRTRCRAYVSFGTVIWRRFAEEAIRSLRVLSCVLGSTPGLRTIISLGGAPLSDDVVASLESPTVQVEPYVDQWAVLQDADLFVTHHGLNSTHEAIYHRVPMLSHPFFWDQPGLASKCREFGLAVPLSKTPLSEITEEDVRMALEALEGRRDAIHEKLALASRWEVDVIRSRGRVIDRILSLAQATDSRAR
jgi:UDP:flavonoid glycosyltransferase YjiC (YdhE family)